MFVFLFAHKKLSVYNSDNNHRNDAFSNMWAKRAEPSEKKTNECQKEKIEMKYFCA